MRRVWCWLTTRHATGGPARPVSRNWGMPFRENSLVAVWEHTCPCGKRRQPTYGTRDEVLR